MSKKLEELLIHLIACPMGRYDLKADDRAWLQRMAELTVEVAREPPDGTFDALAELTKWRAWALRLLGCSEAYRGDDDELRNQINAAPEPTSVGDDGLRRDLDDLRLALRDVPPDVSMDACPSWIVRLHRAACEVAGIGVREDEPTDVPPGSVGIAFRAYTAEANTARTPDPEIHSGRPMADCDADEALRAAQGRCLRSGCSGVLEVEPGETVRRCAECDMCWTAAYVAKRAAMADRTKLVVAPERTPPAPSGSWRDSPPNVTEPPEPPELPICARCNAPLLFSARARGDGLCGPCHREDHTYMKGSEQPEATGTQSATERIVDDAQRFDAFAELVKWRHWAVRLLGGGAFQSDDEIRSAVGAAPDPVPPVSAEQPSGPQLCTVVLNILRTPAGRAAIADCMRRPPVRMADGSWREPTPGSEAKPGDLVRQIGSPAGPWKTVIEVDGADTWVQDGLRRQAWRTADVEVVMPRKIAAATCSCGIGDPEPYDLHIANCAVRLAAHARDAAQKRSTP